MSIIVKHPIYRSGLLPTVLYDRNCRILTIKGTSQPKLTKEEPSGEGKETVIKTNVEHVVACRLPVIKTNFEITSHNANEVLENREWQETRDQKLYSIGREKEEKGVLHKAEVENLLRNLVTRSRIRRNGLKKILLCNDILPKTGFMLKDNAEDVEHEQKDYRLQPVGTESKVKLNGLYVSAKALNQF